MQKQNKWTKIDLAHFDNSRQISGTKDNGLVTKESDWKFIATVPIANEKGQILMIGFLNGQKHMAVLTPVK